MSVTQVLKLLRFITEMTVFRIWSRRAYKTSVCDVSVSNVLFSIVFDTQGKSNQPLNLYPLNSREKASLRSLILLLRYEFVFWEATGKMRTLEANVRQCCDSAH